MTPKVGDVVIVKKDERNRGKWQLGVIVHLLTGKDGFVRGSRYYERERVSLREMACCEQSERLVFRFCRFS